MLGIDQVNYAIEGGRLTPTLVAPVAAAIGEHAGEVTDCCNARAGKSSGAGVSVSPCVAAVSGLEDEVLVVVGEATATFVHTGDVDPPIASHVSRDLHVADEGSLSAHHHRGIVPRDAIITGESHEDVRVGLIKVVPGNVHPTEEGRAGVIVGPARFAVARTFEESAIMRPAIGIPGCGRLISTQALTTATTIQPHRKPGGRRLVVQNHGVTKGIGKRAWRKPSERQAAVRGDRRAGKGVVGRAS